MVSYIEKPRYVCALGAFETVLAIERAVPILHAGPGCGAKLDAGLGNLNGCQGAGYISPHILPCTNIGQQEVIFGGDQRLAETIEHALKIYDGDLFVVLTGCSAEIVGDDVREVVSRFSQSGKPVIVAETAGFKGSNILGHELVVDALIDQYLTKQGSVNPRLVNLWAPIPYFNSFWAGDLKAIASLLREIGLIPNLVFGPEGGIQQLNRVPEAAFNLLISPWAGLKNVIGLQEKFGTPYLHYPVLPIGPTETSQFLRRVAQYAHIPGKVAEEVIARHERDYYYFIERASDDLIKTRLLPSRFYTIADSFYSLGLTRFLVNDMGLIPETQFITDDTPEAFRPSVKAEFERVETSLEVKVEFVQSSGPAQQLIRERGFRGKPLILGSGWEKTFSQQVNAHFLPLSAPLLERMVLNRTYAGYDGALTLLEDIGSLLLSSYL